MYSGDSSGSSDYTGPAPYAHYIEAASASSTPGSHLEPPAAYNSEYHGSSSAFPTPSALLDQNYQIAPHLQQRDLDEQYIQSQGLVRFNHPQAQQWPPVHHLSHSSTAGAEPHPSSWSNTSSLTTREHEQLLMSASAQSLHLQGLSPIEQFLYNEQLMLRMAQTSRVDHRTSAYDMLNQATGHAISSTSSEYLGSTATGRGYEEACTPRPRWSPTQEQIQILESLFNSGTTTPSRDMIVEIAAELRKFGTIAEANVFYWFQNRKARAKRKQLQPRVPPP
ncbi:hypothetical protein L7F22_051506 [Adiantum nelumboides]|nr:hypothetical protein [Adiantum nelumboides]